MAKHTQGPWTLTHVSGSNFAVQRFELRGMFGDAPNVYPIFNRDTSAIDGGTFCASPENARLIAAAPDHAAIGWAMCVATGQWEPWGDGRGEFCLNGIRHTTRLDEFGVLEMTPGLRVAIAKASGEPA